MIKKALKLAPSDAEVYLNYGVFYAKSVCGTIVIVYIIVYNKIKKHTIQTTMEAL